MVARKLVSAEAIAVSIPVGDGAMAGDLVIPPHPRGVVLFAHSSGSSRHSPRNRYVAQELQKAGMGDTANGPSHPLWAMV